MNHQKALYDKRHDIEKKGLQDDQQEPGRRSQPLCRTLLGCPGACQEKFTELMNLVNPGRRARLTRRRYWTMPEDRDEDFGKLLQRIRNRGGQINFAMPVDIMKVALHTI